MMISLRWWSGVSPLCTWQSNAAKRAILMKLISIGRKVEGSDSADPGGLVQVPSADSYNDTYEIDNPI